MCLYVYILELNDGRHYVGYTVNLKERYNRHKKDMFRPPGHTCPWSWHGAVLSPISIKLMNLKPISNQVLEGHLQLSIRI